MFTLFYKNIRLACLFLPAIFLSSLASAKVMMSAEQRSYLRAEREFNSYEWTCGLLQNDYDYVMTVHALKAAISNYDTTFFGIILLGYGPAISIFFLIAMAKYGTPKPLTLLSTSALIAVLSIFPIAAHNALNERTAPQLIEIQQLKDKLQTLNPVDSEIIRTCRPEKRNVNITLIKEVTLE